MGVEARPFRPRHYKRAPIGQSSAHALLVSPHSASPRARRSGLSAPPDHFRFPTKGTASGFSAPHSGLSPSEHAVRADRRGHGGDVRRFAIPIAFRVDRGHCPYRVDGAKRGDSRPPWPGNRSLLLRRDSFARAAVLLPLVRSHESRGRDALCDYQRLASS